MVRHQCGHPHWCPVDDNAILGAIERAAKTGIDCPFGWPDAFVTNDNMANFLFHNLGNGKFEEVALAAGTALP